MIKNLSSLQNNTRHASCAKRLTEILRVNKIEPSPIAVANAFNKEHKSVSLKARSVRKWLLGESKPSQETIVLLAEWLKVDAEELLETPKTGKPGIEIDFTDQEVISKFLSMNLKQKVAVSLLIDTILEKAR
jgi:transcriptional regulator with XRE-family HTH domain